mmetsp:Transcript_6039/g.9997  ORF Transcript_6039/g.9997 Transcript_6039/m.9997 type:complete len:308 (+) Transcript_6039:50-973(+)
MFMKDIAPQFFDKQTHLRSFHRQLSIWGFTRLETGAGGRGVWFHKHFIQDQPELIKNIKRVPVKNPKPTVQTPKNRLPDYTNYQLPVSFNHDSLFNAKGSHSSMAKPVPVHHPRGNGPADVAASANGMGTGLPDSRILHSPGKASMSVPPPPQEGMDYLSTLGRMTPAAAPRFFHPDNPSMPLQAPLANAPPIAPDQARRYPPYGLTNYQSSGAPSSMNQLPPISTGNPNIPPAPNEIGEVAHQLMSYRNNPPQHGNNSLNEALLARIMESRRLANPANNGGAGMNNQDFLSAIALRNFFPQGPKSS